KNILELYSGTGSLTCYLAENASHVTSIEDWRGAVKMAERNLQANNFTNVNALCGRSEEIIGDLRDSSFDAVVLDPPRDGCERRVLDAINNFGIRKIIYVSCNPATLARDCKILSSYGYRLESIRAFDMFPQTAHVETVCLLTHKG
ncbi:MAG: class I SAM-dependent RNA methyltransferase, partial [Synergistaceae bacterium]|nr:class I SAM-dependent RNA methyltransferase [Synergistaceae bacterium]